jgi:hypothetical protein
MKEALQNIIIPYITFFFAFTHFFFLSSCLSFVPFLFSPLFSLLNQLYFHNYCYEKRKKIKNIYTHNIEWKPLWMYMMCLVNKPLEIYFWHPKSKINFKKFKFVSELCKFLSKTRLIYLCNKTNGSSHSDFSLYHKFKQNHEKWVKLCNMLKWFQCKMNLI